MTDDEVRRDLRTMMECATRLFEHLLDRPSPPLAFETTGTLEPLLVSVAEAAKALGISRDFLYEINNRGECPAARDIGGRKMFSVVQLREWVASGPRVLAGPSTRKA